MQTDVVIIGGGLSGLHTAYECHKHGLDYLLLEARNRLGGRVLSANDSVYEPEHPAIDLGPSWFWPGQSGMQRLIAELQLTNFVINQYGLGDAIFEDNQGNIRRGVDGISMAGAYRLSGGIAQLIYRLLGKISSRNYFTEAVVNSLDFSEKTITTSVAINHSIKNIKSRFVVLAMPPRVAMNSIRFTPVLPVDRVTTLNNIATWMAGHAKICMRYAAPFWRTEGLSGDAISHAGPLQEIHDASSEDGSLSALFGFINIPPQHRKEREKQIKVMSVAQLVRLFGQDAASPAEFYFKDWAQDAFTATGHDQQIQRFHPANDITTVTESSWNHQLVWSGSESAAPHLGNNGFLEGALESSIRTSRFLQAQLK